MNSDAFSELFDSAFMKKKALNTSSEEKNRQERTPLLNVKESFPKIIIQNGTKVNFLNDQTTYLGNHAYLC